MTAWLHSYSLIYLATVKGQGGQDAKNCHADGKIGPCVAWEGATHDKTNKNLLFLFIFLHHVWFIQKLTEKHFCLQKCLFFPPASSCRINKPYEDCEEEPAWQQRMVRWTTPCHYWRYKHVNETHYRWQSIVREWPVKSCPPPPWFFFTLSRLNSPIMFSDEGKKKKKKKVCPYLERGKSGKKGRRKPWELWRWTNCLDWQKSGIVWVLKEHPPSYFHPSFTHIFLIFFHLKLW